MASSKRGRKKRYHNPSVITTKVDMAAVYKNNIAEDKKLETRFVNLKRKERVQIFKHYSQIKEINDKLSDMQLEKDSVTHTFDEDEIRELDKELKLGKKRFREAVHRVQRIRQNSRNETNSTAVISNGKNDNMQRFFNVTNQVLQKNQRGFQNGSKRVQWYNDDVDSDSDEHETTSSFSFSTSSKSRTPWSNLYHRSIQARNSPLSNRSSFSPQNPDCDDSDDESTAVNTFRRPLTRAVSCRSDLSKSQCSLPAIEVNSDLRKKCSIMRRRRVSAALNSPTTSKQIEPDCIDDSTGSDQRLEAIKQDIKTQNNALGERIQNFLNRVSPRPLPKDRSSRRRESLTFSSSNLSVF